MSGIEVGMEEVMCGNFLEFFGKKKFFKNFFFG